MSNTFPVTVGAIKGYGASVSNKKANSLDQDAFLTILTTQMKNQNPLEPMDDKEFISQMASFSSLEQMEQMSGMTTKSYGQSLIGKGIMADSIYNATDKKIYTAAITGPVDGIATISGTQYLVVGDYYVPLDAVKSVIDISEYETTNDNPGTDTTDKTADTTGDTAAV